MLLLYVYLENCEKVKYIFSSYSVQFVNGFHFFRHLLFAIHSDRVKVCRVDLAEKIARTHTIPNSNGKTIVYRLFRQPKTDAKSRRNINNTQFLRHKKTLIGDVSYLCATIFMMLTYTAIT